MRRAEVRLVFVPGFSQPASAWNAVLAALHPSFDATTVDVPDHLDFPSTAAALGALGGRGIYVGYSMGGRLALHLARQRPDLVTGLVLVSASPGIVDPEARAARIAADAQLAAEVERDGVPAFLERWLAQPLFADVSIEQAGFDERVAGTSVARLVHQLTVLGQGTMPASWDHLTDVSMPTLLVTGAHDAKYGEIASAMCERNPRFEHSVLPGGHAVLLEQPIALADRLVAFVHDRFPASA